MNFDILYKSLLSWLFIYVSKFVFFFEFSINKIFLRYEISMFKKIVQARYNDDRWRYIRPWMKK